MSHCFMLHYAFADVITQGKFRETFVSTIELHGAISRTYYPLQR